MSFPQVLTGVAHIGIPTNDLDTVSYTHLTLPTN